VNGASANKGSITFFGKSSLTRACGMRLYDCTVVGDVFFDVLAQKKTGGESLRRGGTLYLDHAKLMPGGSGNVAMGMTLLGLKTAFIGKAGKDLLGNLYKEDLESNSVSAKIFFEQDSPTGIAIVLTEPKGERSFLVLRGANDKLKPEEIEISERLLETSRFVYVCGYSLVSSDQTNAILKTVEIAKHHHVKVVFDPGAYNLIESKPRLFQRLLASCDVFCPNLKEALSITNTRTLRACIEGLRQDNRLTAIKLGAKGSILIDGGKTIKTPAFEVGVVDTTGAGDAFIAGIVYGLVQNLPLELTARLANWYGAQVITSYGARSHPHREEILSFLRTLEGSQAKEDQTPPVTSDIHFLNENLCLREEAYIMPNHQPRENGEFPSVRALVIGGAGFIGSNLCGRLSEMGWEVTALDNLCMGQSEPNFGRFVRFMRGDGCSIETLRKALKGVDYVFHEAALSSSQLHNTDPAKGAEINIVGFAKLLKLASKAKVQKVVYASTSSIYGNSALPQYEDMKVEPPNFYAATKYAMEQYARIFYESYGLQAIGLRYFSVYGPGETHKKQYANILTQFIWNILREERPAIWGDGTQTRDLIHVEDVVKANILAADGDLECAVINVGTGRETSLNKLIGMISKAAEKEVEPTYLPIPTRSYIYRQRASTEKAEKLIGFKHEISVEEGVKRTLQFYRVHSAADSSQPR